MADHDQQNRWEAEQFRLLVENVKDYAIFILDPEGKIVTWSLGAARLLGYPADEAIGQHIGAFFTPEDRERGEPEREMRQATQTGRGEDDRWHVRKDGTRFWCSGVLTPLHDDGQVVGFAKIMRDLTERKLHEDARRESEERLRSLVTTVLDGIITIDQHGVIQSLNPAAEKVFGYRASEVVGQNVRLLMPDPYRDEHDAFIANYLRTGQANIIGVGREVEGRRKDGSTFPMDLAVSEFRHQGRRFFTGVVRDITDRRRAEAMLRERAEQLEAANRHKDTFLAMLGHEMRNPLAPIVTSLHVLRADSADDAIRQHALNMVERQVRHMTRLVDDLLEVSRIAQAKVDLKKEDVELSNVLGRAVETTRQLMESRRHHLSVSPPDEPVWLEADPTRLEQVVTNLLNNAAKYTEPGGRVWLSAGREGDTAIIQVRDTGIGIAPTVLPRIFDLFTQAEQSLARSQGGLGLGLTLVRRLVELHGGTVEAFSQGPGRGSEFVVRLPVVSSQPVPTPASPGHRRTPASPLRVLIVDDNNDAADSMRMLLQISGHEVIVAHAGPTGFQQATAWRPDVVLLDIGLPGMDGYEVARRLRELPEMQNMVIVAMTGYGQETDRQKSQAAGINYHLVKPVDPQKLQDLLAVLVDQRRQAR
jgi:PAS domain S-box-containing protein